MAVALACVTGAFAQKQTGGEKNLEVQFAPFSSTPMSISGVRFRMFTSETSAFRLNVSLGGGKVTTATDQKDSVVANSPTLYNYQSHMDFTIRPGYEMHFAGTDRLSPYVGAEVVFGLHSQKQEQEFYSSPTTTNTSSASDNTTWTATVKNGQTVFGANAVAGVDYYFADNIYLGAEILFGVMHTSEHATTTEVDNTAAYNVSTGQSPNASVKFPDHVNGGTTNWGTNVQGTIRLGWLFN